MQNINNNQPGARQGQEGIALFTAMVLLLALTIAAIVSMRTVALDYKLGTNANQRSRAFEIAENARLLASGVMDAHIDDRGWELVTLSEGFQVAHASTPAGLLYAGNNADLGDLTSRALDFRYSLNFLDGGAEVFVTRLDRELATGTGAATAEGYAGLGFGTAAGGGHIFFDIRSVGTAGRGARALTGADFRHVIR